MISKVERKEKIMTVKTLIKELLELPMDAEVELAIFNEENGHYTYYATQHAVNYEDNTVGIVNK